MSARTWTTADIPDQSGRTAVVTGSNTGLGLETARKLARAGATVVLASRNPDKLAAAHADLAADLAGRPGAGTVETLVLDLGDLSAVADAAAETRERFPTIDLLVNNAGVMTPPRSTTADGFELQFGTNHLGHFAYTGQILDSLLGVDGSRVVTVSSIAHRRGGMRWDDLQWEQRYSRQQSYGQSKLANLLFTFALERRLRAASAPTVALASHPGVSATELTRHLPGADKPVIGRAIEGSTALLFQGAEAGAWPSLRAATDPSATGGQYYGPAKLFESRGAPILVEPRRAARDEADQDRLWTVSEELTGVEFPV